MNEIQSYNTLFVPLKSANIIIIMFRPIRTHQYSSESEIPSMSHHFQILSLCERKNLRDLCWESNPGPLNYMSRAHYLYHWIRDLDLASFFLKQPKMRDLGVHFPKIFRGRAPDPLFLATFARFAPAPHLKTSSYASAPYCILGTWNSLPCGFQKYKTMLSRYLHLKPRTGSGRRTFQTESPLPSLSPQYPPPPCCIPLPSQLPQDPLLLHPSTDFSTSPLPYLQIRMADIDLETLGSSEFSTCTPHQHSCSVASTPHCCFCPSLFYILVEI